MPRIIRVLLMFLAFNFVASFGNFRRMVQINSVVWRYYIIPSVFSGMSALSGPERLRRAFIELGGAWLKLGQALALRYDLLPKEYCRELFYLFNDVDSFPYNEVREIIRDELGDYPESLFLTIEPKDFSAASIGQVHRAQLYSGEAVVVKVQRPGVRQEVISDINLMYSLVQTVNSSGFLGATDSRLVVQDFESSIERELDYRIEARQAQTMLERARDSKIEKTPTVYWEYTSSRVLTMEMIEGIPIIEIMNAMDRGEEAEILEVLGEWESDLAQVAENISWNLMNQVFIEGYFHADLHPANLFVYPGNVVAYVDFGIVGRLSTEFRESMLAFFWHLFHEDVDRAAGEFLRWVSPSHDTNMRGANRGLIDALEEWLFRIRSPDVHIRGEDHDKGFLLEVEMMSVIRRYHMALEPELILFMKTFSTALKVITTISPKFEIHTQASQFFGQMLSQKARDLADPGHMSQAAFEYGLQARRVYQAITRIEEAGDIIDTVIVMLRYRIHALGVLILAALLGIFITSSFGFYSSLTDIVPSSIRNSLPFVLLVVLLALLSFTVIQIFVFFSEGREVPRARRRKSTSMPREFQRMPRIDKEID